MTFGEPVSYTHLDVYKRQVLMLGMDTMSTAVEPLAEQPEFSHILLMFSNPVLGMLVGLILTAVIQSSSASIGILQALCATGVVSYATAIPIIMGQNVGTCVTALISSAGADVYKRQILKKGEREDA